MTEHDAVTLRMVDHATDRASLARWGATEDQVLLGAAGNAILEFASLDTAKAWTARYSRWLYDTAPGLEVVVAHRVTEARKLAWGLKALQIDLARAKVERIPSAPQLGLRARRECGSTQTRRLECPGYRLR